MALSKTEADKLFQASHKQLEGILRKCIVPKLAKFEKYIDGQLKKRYGPNIGISIEVPVDLNENDLKGLMDAYRKNGWKVEYRETEDDYNPDHLVFT